MNESEFPEFIHEKINSRASGPDHFRQHSLRYLGKHFLRLAWFAILREQQKSTGQPFLAGIKELIDQVFFKTDAPRQDVRDKTVGEGMFSVERPKHLLLFNTTQSGRSDSCRRCHTKRQPSQASFTKKLAWP